MNRLGLRREDKNEWERRVPLTPDHVAELIENHSISISVQPSALRAFPDIDFERAGADTAEDLSECAVVLGVKEIPPALFRRDGVYLFFSHTTKGQTHNMPSLRRMLDLGCTLIDYEQVFGRNNRRLIFFGRHAGYAGMIDALWMLGKRFEERGLRTPLREIRLAHHYAGLDEAIRHIFRLGEQLRHEGVPRSLNPFVVGFTGSGNVAQGAQEIFDHLPHEVVPPEDLAALAADIDRPGNLLFKVVFQRHHRVRRADGGPFDSAEFEAHPERYVNGMDRWLQYLTLLVHGSFWNPEHPRLVSKDDLAKLWADGTPHLEGIADISNDIHGGIEATVRAAVPANPCYVWDLDRGAAIDGVSGRGPVILAIDNLPCQLPVEASEHFGDGLLRFIPALARCDWSQPLETLNLPEELKRAIVAHQGSLAPKFQYLETPLNQHGDSPP